MAEERALDSCIDLAAVISSFDLYGVRGRRPISNGTKRLLGGRKPFASHGSIFSEVLPISCPADRFRDLRFLKRFSWSPL